MSSAFRHFEASNPTAFAQLVELCEGDPVRAERLFDEVHRHGTGAALARERARCLEHARMLRACGLAAFDVCTRAVDAGAKLEDVVGEYLAVAGNGNARAHTALVSILHSRDARHGGASA